MNKEIDELIQKIIEKVDVSDTETIGNIALMKDKINKEFEELETSNNKLIEKNKEISSKYKDVILNYGFDKKEPVDESVPPREIDFNDILKAQGFNLGK